MNTIIDVISVKQNLMETPTLHADTQGAVLSINQQQTRLPDDKLTRWLLRASFAKMQATPQGAGWFTQTNPMTLPQDIIALMSNPPMPYQLTACARMLIGNCALWLDMGLGKTFVTLLYFLIRHKRDNCNNFLVICPPTVFVSWQTEIATHLANVPHEIIIAHGPKKNKLLREAHLEPKNRLSVIMTSYESLLSIAGRIKLLNISGIVFDECSKIKNYRAKRTKAAHMVTRENPNASVHLLSGTPSTKTPEGFYSLLELLGQGRSESSGLIAFINTYVEQVCIARCKVNPGGETVFIRADKHSDYERWLRSHNPPGETESYWKLGYAVASHQCPPHMKHVRVLNTFGKPIGAKNLDKLHKIMLKNAYCLKKEDVAKDLPPKNHVVRMVEMSEEIKQAYKIFIEEHKIALNLTRFSFVGAGNPHMKLHQIVNGFFYTQDGTSHWFNSQPKIDELLAILEEAGDQKVVIWSPFRAQILGIERALKAAEIQYRSIHGGTGVAVRPQLVNDFRTNPDVRCLIANPDVAGMGLTLVEAHLAVVMTNWFKADVRAQLIDRLHRIGQVNPVTVIDLVCPGTLEPRILHCLKNNLDVETTVLTGAKTKGLPHEYHAGTGETPCSTARHEGAAD